MQDWDTEYLWQISTWRKEIKLRSFSSQQAEKHFLIPCLSLMITGMLFHCDQNLQENSSEKIWQNRKTMNSRTSLCNLMLQISVLSINVYFFPLSVTVYVHCSSKFYKIHGES